MLLHADGFDAISTATGASTTTYLQRRYTSVSAGTTQAGRLGGVSINNATFVYTPASAKATLVVGFAYNATGYGQTVFEMRDNATQQVTFVTNTDGSVSITRAGTVLGTSAAGVVPLGQWNYFEAKVTIDNSAGSYEVRKNGVTVLSGTGKDTQNTANASATNILFRSSFCYFDDLYIADTSGTANNDFLGDVNVKAYFPDADGTSEQWTLSAGTDSFALLDDNPADDDATYIETSTTGQTTRVTHQDVGSTDTILAVSHVVLARKTDASATGIKLTQFIGGASYDDGTTPALSTSFTYYERVMDVNPATSGPWSPAAVNAAEFGVASSF